MTIIQTNSEIGLLTNKITLTPSLPAYTPAQNPAPLVRTLINNLLTRLDNIPYDSDTNSSDTANNNVTSKPIKQSLQEIRSIYPHLPVSMKRTLLAEVIHAITAIGGHENPPARHIVGFEAVGSVKEKLKTVSEELEDFVEVSNAVDIDDGMEEGDTDGAGDSGER